MSDAMNEFREVEHDLIRRRWLNRGYDSPEVDILLERMDDAWQRLSPEEQTLIDAETPRSLIRKEPPPASEQSAEDKAVATNSTQSPRRREVEAA